MRGPAAGGAAIVGAVPVTWDILGYPFEAGPFIVTVCAVIMTRLIVSLNTKRPRWALDLLVTALCGLIAALWVQAHQLSLLPAGISGIGFGAVGLGIIGMAKSQAAIAFRAALQTFFRGMAVVPEPKLPEDADADLLRQLD